MRSIKRILSLLILTAMVSACSSIKVTYDYDKSFDFNDVKTFEYYGWAAERDKILNQLEKQRIEAAFGEELRKRGMKYVESGGDLIVGLFVMAQEKTQYNAPTTGMGYGGYYGYGPGWGWGPGYGVGMTTTTVSEYNYTVGTLVIDMYDPSNEQLVFESIGTGTVDDNPQSREKKLPGKIAQIMAPFPKKPVADKK